MAGTALPPLPSEEEHGALGQVSLVSICHSVATWLHKSFTLSEVSLLIYKVGLKCLSLTGKLPGISEQMGERHLRNV